MQRNVVHTEPVYKPLLIFVWAKALVQAHIFRLLSACSLLLLSDCKTTTNKFLDLKQTCKRLGGGLHLPKNKLWTVYQSSFLNVRNKIKAARAQVFPYKTVQGFLVLERVFWSRDAHEQWIILGMPSTVAHQVWWRLGHLQRKRVHCPNSPHWSFFNTVYWLTVNK